MDDRSDADDAILAALDERGRRALESLAVSGPSPEAPTAFDVRSSLTGSLIGSLPRQTAADVAAAAARARTAQREWAATPMPRRSRILKAFHDLVLAERRALLDLVQWESGKARADAFEEVADVAMTARYYANTAARHLADRRRRGLIPALTRTVEHRQPKGVVGVIAPWNYPLTLAASDALAALAAGNAVILKPDSQTPHTALAVRSLLVRAGLDHRLFQVVTGKGAELGPPLVEACDCLMFTGSSATGAQVASQAGARLVAASAELGGKNPLIVCQDANLGRAVPGALKACFSNSGQLCVSVERVYVHERVWDRFVPAFARAAGKLRVARTMDWEADMGPLIDPGHLAKVDAYVRDALGKGARLLAGGYAVAQAGPAGYAPTILAGVTEDMDVFAEETFGPVVAVYPVSGEDEAVRLANATAYGLNASVWSRDARRGVRIAKRIHAGTVNVNEGYAAAWASLDAPMGGMKASGLGRRHGAEGILKYTEAQTIAVQRLVNLQAPRGMGQETWARALVSYLEVLRRLPGFDR